MTPEKAEKEFRWMLEETMSAEALAIENQYLLGDACRELRLAYGIPRNALVGQLGIDGAGLVKLERRCSTDRAKAYHAAITKLIPDYARALKAKEGKRE